jgi:hypothetical protein
MERERYMSHGHRLDMGMERDTDMGLKTVMDTDTDMDVEVDMDIDFDMDITTRHKHGDGHSCLGEDPFSNSNVGYRISEKKISDIRHNVRLRPLQSDIGSTQYHAQSDIRS